MQVPFFLCLWLQNFTNVLIPDSIGTSSIFHEITDECGLLEALNFAELEHRVSCRGGGGGGGMRESKNYDV